MAISRKRVQGCICADKKIETDHTYSELKSCVAERFIRTLKSIINKYFEQKYNFKIICKNLKKTINTRKTASTKSSPIDVEQKHVNKLVQLAFPNAFKINKTKRRNNNVRKSRRKNLFNLGDPVRILSRTDIPFQKGYQQRFTDELFLIKFLTSHLCSKRLK